MLTQSYLRGVRIYLGDTIPDILGAYCLLHTIRKVQNLEEERDHLVTKPGKLHKL